MLDLHWTGFANAGDPNLSNSTQAAVVTCKQRALYYRPSLTTCSIDHIRQGLERLSEYHRSRLFQITHLVQRDLLYSLDGFYLFSRRLL